MGCSQSTPHRSRKKRSNRSFRNRRKRRPPPPHHDQPDGDVTCVVADVSEFDGPPQAYRPEYLNHENQTVVQSGYPTRNPALFKQATYVSIHNMRIHHLDSKECRIRGAEFLPNGNLVVCDQANFLLKLWSQTFQYLNHFQLQGKPQDLCVHSSNREGSDVYVTIPSDRTIMEFYIEGKVIVPGRKIRTDGWCYGIAPYKNGLVVCVSSKIEFLDPDGNIRKVLQFDKHGRSIFGSPFHIAVTGGHYLLVSDSMRGYVMCINADGEELFRYEEMSTPHDLMVDSLGNIYLCGAELNAVDVLHQITKDGEKVKSLLSWRHVGFTPDTICFRERDQLLAVFGENDRMKTFRLYTRRTGKICSNDAIMKEETEARSPRDTPEVQEMMKRIYLA